jgi:flagellar basal-body rod modification protein FlgD
MSVPVDAIGSILNQQDTTITSHNSINQDEFIKLFLAQLQFQDPLEPVDNREFLAQLAQFSNLQQSTQTANNTEGMLVQNSSAQSLALLGKTVTVGSGTQSATGRVIGVTFDSSGPQLSIDIGTVAQPNVITNIRLSAVTIVK